MLSQEKVLELVKSKQLTSECIDGRDFGRLATYFPTSEWEHFGYKLKDGAEHEPTPWTKENILDKMRGDVAFGFRKALDKRGISASLMHSVVRMWLFILRSTSFIRGPSATTSNTAYPHSSAWLLSLDSTVPSETMRAPRTSTLKLCTTRETK